MIKSNTRPCKAFTLREIRKERGIHIEAVCKFMGLKREIIYKWETGERCPRTIHLEKLAKFYAMTIDELMEVLAETYYIWIQKNTNK